MGRSRYASVTVVGLIAVSIYITIQFANRPALGTITNLGPADPIISKPTMQMIPIAGSTVTFSYPKGFVAHSLPAPVTPIVEAYQYLFKDVRTSQLSLTVLTLDVAGKDSSLALRRQDPEHYIQSTITSGDNSFTVMTDTRDSFNKVAYSFHNGLVGEIALIGNTAQGTSQLDDVFAQVLDAWRWR
jgi:hypothetical protein